MSTGLENWENTGDWTQAPWFLDGEDEVFVSMGFPLEARREAATHLARVFTPVVCRAIREDPMRGYGVAILLFQQYWPGMLIPLFEVGQDLGVVQPWNDSTLLTRLTRRSQFHEAAFELRVLANLRRRGYRAERVPESSEETPDLVTLIGTEEHDVEVKAVHPSPVDHAADAVHRELMVGDLIVPGLNLELRGSSQLAAQAQNDLTALIGNRTSVVAAFRQAVDDIRHGGARPGLYEAPPYGTVLATPAGPTHGSVTPLVLPDLSDEQQIVKAIRLVRRAAKQLSTRRGIVMLGVWHSANLLDLAERIRHEAKLTPEAFRSCHMVVLVDSVSEPDTDYRSIPLAVPVQVHERRHLTKAQLRFASVAAGKGGRDAAFVRSACPGEHAFEMSTRRRALTAVSLGSVPLPTMTGGQVRFHFDGRPPTVSPAQPERSDSDATG